MMARPKLASRGKRTARRLIALNNRRHAVGLPIVSSLTKAVEDWAELIRREKGGAYDVNKDTASALFQVPSEQLTREQVERARAINHANLFSQ